MREPVAEGATSRRSTQRRGAATRKNWRPDFTSEFQAALYKRQRPECAKCGATLYIEPGWSWCRHCRLGWARPVAVMEGAAKPVRPVYCKSDILKELYQTLSLSDAQGVYANCWLKDERLAIVNDIDDPGAEAGNWQNKFASPPILAKVPST
jgi:hypothetical protein